jgi:hypothetical protein
VAHYWAPGISTALKLAGEAIALICLAQKPTYSPAHRARRQRYGVSAETLRGALDELRRTSPDLVSHEEGADGPLCGITARTSTGCLEPFRGSAEPIVLGLGEEAKTAAA